MLKESITRHDCDSNICCGESMEEGDSGRWHYLLKRISFRERRSVEGKQWRSSCLNKWIIRDALTRAEMVSFEIDSSNYIE